MPVPVDFATGLNELYPPKILHGDPPSARFTTGREAVEALPATLRVGPFDFSMQKWTAQQAQAQNRFGKLSVVELRISIQIDMPSPQKAADTFLHEAGHAIWWTYHLADEDKEERIVAVFVKAWLQVFRDNPLILPWIQRCC